MAGTSFLPGVFRGLAAVLVALVVLAPAGADSPVPSAHRDCGSCHGADASPAPPDPGDRPALPDAGVCLRCHTEYQPERGSVYASLDERDRRSHGHLPPAGRPALEVPPGGREIVEWLDCLSCHSAHPNERPAFLKTPESGAAAPARGLDTVSQFCVGCHVRFAETRGHGGRYTRHPVGIPARLQSPAGEDGPVLPLVDVRGTDGTEDDVIACTTCHYTHRGPNVDLLRWDADGEGDACRTCHRVGSRAPGSDLVAYSR